MQVKNREIYDARQPLGELIAKEIPVRVAYQVLELADIFDARLKKTEVIRKQLITKYGEPDPTAPGQFFVNQKSDKYPKFTEEREELMDIEIESDWQPLKIPDTLQITPLSLRALKRFIRV